jgi:hypothetical protein
MMMKNQLDRDEIAEEAVGQKHDSPPPYAVKKENTSPETVRQMALSSGSQASIPAKTAESLGERVGNAYSDPGSAAPTQKRRAERQPRAQASGTIDLGRQVVQVLSRQFNEQPLVTVVACFGLGYLTAVLLRGRANADLGTRPVPFQIMKPPQADTHPRGFVQSTVLKAITEHPQGIRTAELIDELSAQGIGQDSIAIALDALVQAEKVRSQDSDGKYVTAAAEVPTAPDQPSP